MSPMSNPLQDWLRQKYPQAKQNTLRQMLRDGRVHVNGKCARRMNQPIQATDRIEVLDRIKDLPLPAASIHPLKLIFEDEQLLVVDKPAGLLTSTTTHEKRLTVLAILDRYLRSTDPNARLGLIHRLDRDASGLLVFSKTPEAFNSLKKQFYKHSVRREYVAVTRGVPTPAAGRIESFLVELPDGAVRSSKRPRKGQRAITDYATLARAGGQAAVRVTLDTGRKHQIRAQLNERGIPIVGDRMYRPDDSTPRLMLAAVILGFEHPANGEKLWFEIEIPKQLPMVGGKKLSDLRRMTNDEFRHSNFERGTAKSQQYPNDGPEANLAGKFSVG